MDHLVNPMHFRQGFYIYWKFQIIYLYLANVFLYKLITYLSMNYSAPYVSYLHRRHTNPRVSLNNLMIAYRFVKELLVFRCGKSQRKKYAAYVQHHHHISLLLLICKYEKIL